MTARRRIGILGGTFDPIHTGHVALASAAQARLGLTRVIVMPSHIPPHRRQPLASSFHRFAMVALAVVGRTGWQSSDLELQIDRPSYTTDTIQSFHDLGFSPAELFFIIGADAFAEIGTWKDYPDILERAHFAVVSRPGYPVDELPVRLPQLAARMRGGRSGKTADSGTDSAVNHTFDWTPDQPSFETPVIILIDAPTPDVSATAIRERCAEGAPITGMVDPHVQHHIEQHGLYTPTSPGRWDDAHTETPAAGRLHGQS
jgi:nicotinate-nucleotide adenylyltransferase